MKISVIGCGYLGAVHAVVMARLGHEVVGVDLDFSRIEMLKRGEPPFFEPALKDLLTKSIATGRLAFSTEIAAARTAEVHFIAVGTPQLGDSGGADLSYVWAALNSLIPHLADGALVVGKSTVPVGTAADLAAVVRSRAPHATLIWNPEFLREGFAVKDTMCPDRIVYGVEVGTAGERAVGILDQVYEHALSIGTPRIKTDFATAELVKVAANAFLATKISFINAMAEICERVGADVTKLADALGYDERIGRKFLDAGVGFGGGCLPKDVRGFVVHAESLGLGESVSFLREVDKINLRRRDRVVRLALELLGGAIDGCRVTVLGASFKPNSDDVRDSPALDVAARLSAFGAVITVTDPQAIENARAKHPELRYVSDTSMAITGADLVILMTDWQEYCQLDPRETLTRVGPIRDRALIVDGRNCLGPADWREAGWQYFGLGGLPAPNE